MSKQPEIEIYTLTWCPYCRKAKAFFKSKGLDYTEYIVDEESGKKREMLERTDGAKTLPQIFINDQVIGGYDDLIELESAGELNDLLGIDGEEHFDQLWDTIIIGAGPAGLSAAVYGARKGLNILVLSEAMGGQVIETDTIDNYIGKPDVKGLELMQSFWEHTQKYDVQAKLGVKATGVRTEEDLKIVETDSGELEAKTVIAATGTHKRHLGVPGEKELRGEGVHYCAICDGYLYAGEEVAIIGGGNSGLEAALDMAKLDSKVNLIEVQDQLMGDEVLRSKVYDNQLIDVYTCNEVNEIVGDDQVDSLLIRNRGNGKQSELDVAAVFVEIGLVANTGFISDLVETNGRKEIVINENNETSVEGIWAAGDVTDIQDKQIIVATAEGAKAALRANEFLNK